VTTVGSQKAAFCDVEWRSILAVHQNLGRTYCLHLWRCLPAEVIEVFTEIWGRRQLAACASEFCTAQRPTRLPSMFIHA
jgi:hypothetical protein